MATDLEDIFTIVSALQWSSSLAKRVLGSRSQHELHQEMLKALTFASSSDVASNLISLIEENSAFLLTSDASVENTLATYVDLLDSPVQPGGAITQQIKTEILLAATTILIEKEAILKFPSLLEQFVERLYNIIVGINNQNDILHRQMAVECLHELELEYPGLLHEFVFDVLHLKSPLNIKGLLYNLFAAEKSHIRQSYLLLFLETLQHATCKQFVDHVRLKKLTQEQEAEDNGDESSAIPSQTPKKREKKTVFFEIDPTVIELYHKVCSPDYDVTMLPAALETPSSSIFEKLCKCMNVVLEESRYLSDWGMYYACFSLLHLASLIVVAKDDKAAPTPLPVLQCGELLVSFITKDSVLLSHVVTQQWFDQPSLARKHNVSVPAFLLTNDLEDLGDMYGADLLNGTTRSEFHAKSNPLKHASVHDRLRISRQFAMRLNDTTSPPATQFLYLHFLSAALAALKPFMAYYPKHRGTSVNTVINVRDSHFGEGGGFTTTDISADEQNLSLAEREALTARKRTQYEQELSKVQKMIEETREALSGNEDNRKGFPPGPHVLTATFDCEVDNINHTPILARALYPHVFDTVVLKLAKAEALTQFYQVLPLLPLPETLIGTELHLEDDSTRPVLSPESLYLLDPFVTYLLQPPKDFFASCRAFADFCYYPPHSTQAASLFQYVERMMVRFPFQFGRECTDLLLRILYNHPQYTGNVRRLLQSIRDLDGNSDIVSIVPYARRRHATLPSLESYHRRRVLRFKKEQRTMLEHLYTSLLDFISGTTPAAHSTRYLMLVDEVIDAELDRMQSSHLQRESTLLEKAVHCLFRCAGAIHLEGNWHHGRSILSMCRRLALHRLYQSSVMKLLRFLATSFSDVDIREQAAFYLKLITHCSFEQLSKMLQDISSSEPDVAASLSTSDLHQDTRALSLQRATSEDAAQMSSKFVVHEAATRIIRIDRQLRPSPARDSIVTYDVAKLLPFVHAYIFTDVLDDDIKALRTVHFLHQQAKSQLGSKTPAETKIEKLDEANAEALTEVEEVLAGMDKLDTEQLHPRVPDNVIAVLEDQAPFVQLPKHMVKQKGSSQSSRLPIEQLEIDYYKLAFGARSTPAAPESKTQGPRNQLDLFQVTQPGADPQERPIENSCVNIPLYIFFEPSCLNCLDIGADEYNGADPVVAQPFPSEIFGVVLQLSETTHYQKVDPIIFPYLAYPHQVGQSGAPAEHDRFPYVYRFLLSLRPITPVPTSFRCSILFNDNHGNTCKAQLSPIDIRLKDLFRMPPIPLTLIDKWNALLPSSAKREEQRAFLRSYLFVLLWDNILHRPADVFFNSKELSAYLQLRERAKPGQRLVSLHCLETVRYFKISQAEALSRIDEHFRKFLVSHVSHGGDEKEAVGYDMADDLSALRAGRLLDVRRCLKESKPIPAALREPQSHVVFSLRAIVMIAPKYHLLMQFRVSPSSTLVRIRSDFYDLSKYLDAFLDGVFL